MKTSGLDVMTMLAIAAGSGFGSWGLPGVMGKSYSDPLEGVDIEAEYELVKQKKSQLSASLRAEVVRRFEKRNKEGRDER